MDAWQLPMVFSGGEDDIPVRKGAQESLVGINIDDAVDKKSPLKCSRIMFPITAGPVSVDEFFVWRIGGTLDRL